MVLSVQHLSYNFNEHMFYLSIYLSIFLPTVYTFGRLNSLHRWEPLFFCFNDHLFPCLSYGMLNSFKFNSRFYVYILKTFCSTYSYAVTTYRGIILYNFIWIHRQTCYLKWVVIKKSEEKSWHIGKSLFWRSCCN